MLAHVVLAALLLGAPQAARAGDSVVSPRVSADTSQDTVFYVTNRARRGVHLPSFADDSLEFGFVVTRFVERPAPSVAEQVLGQVALQVVDSVRLSREEFTALVREADGHAAQVGEGSVLYVHGYGTSFGRGIRQGAEIAHRGRFRGPFIVFSWPAHSTIATWPTTHALLSHAYRDDSVAASRSGSAFRAGLDVLLGAVRPQSLNVVGHSLGAQLVAEALREPSAVHDSLAASPLHALVFFAPDISAERFRDSLSAPLAPLAGRRVVYTSSSDRMLALSHLVNHSYRLGQLSGARELADADVEVVDITRGRRSFGGGLWRLVDPRHAMRHSGAALYDFFYEVVRRGPATCREGSGLAERESARAWRLTAGPIPPSAPIAAACQAAAGTRLTGSAPPG